LAKILVTKDPFEYLSSELPNIRSTEFPSSAGSSKISEDIGSLNKNWLAVGQDVQAVADHLWRGREIRGSI